MAEAEEAAPEVHEAAVEGAEEAAEVADEVADERSDGRTRGSPEETEEPKRPHPGLEDSRGKAADAERRVRPPTEEGRRAARFRPSRRQAASSEDA